MFVGVGHALLKVSTVDGTILSSMAVDGVIAGGPAIGDPNGDGFPTETILGTDRGTLYAIDTESFRVDWTFPLDGAANGSPALGDVDGDGTAEILIGTAAGNLHAIKVVRGAPVRLWGAAVNVPGFTPPVMANGVVYVGTPKLPGRPRGCGDCLMGWDWRTGEELFRLHIGGGVLGLPIVADGSVFLGADDGNIYACATGQWRRRSPS